jgi:hypothetical protein
MALLITDRPLYQRTPVLNEKKAGWPQGLDVLKEVNRLTLTEIRTPDRLSRSIVSD